MTSAVSGEGSSGAEVDVPILRAPADGMPPLVADRAGFERLISALAGGDGPVAVDTERAHGFRYSPRAYLVQLRRTGSGTWLLDPLPFGDEDFSRLRSAIIDAEWIIHAATQDLPCLAELGLVPQRLFDTELAARLLGYPRVALGTLVEELLGWRLLKEHSASDWSTRPLPTEWLTYAALDVELLIELRDVLAGQLDDRGRRAWADEEFAHLAAHAADPPREREDPWRRTSGTHAVKTPLGMAVVRELWLTRDEIARELDKAPGRILGDQGITDLAATLRRAPFVVGRAQLRAIDRFNRRDARRHEDDWLDAIERVAGMKPSEYPPLHTRPEGPPQPRSWANRDPEAAARWDAARPAINDLAAELGLAPENLLSPDALRRLLWQPDGLDAASLDGQLARLGIREWQRKLCVPVLEPVLAVAS